MRTCDAAAALCMCTLLVRAGQARATRVPMHARPSAKLCAFRGQLDGAPYGSCRHGPGCYSRPTIHTRHTMNMSHLGPPEPPSLAELRGLCLQVDHTGAVLTVLFLLPLHLFPYATL